VSWISFEESDGSDLEFMVEDLEKFLSGIQSISDENITSKNDYKGYKVVEQMNNRKRQVNTDQNSVIKRTKLDICYERRTDDQNEREYEGNHLSGKRKSKRRKNRKQQFQQMVQKEKLQDSSSDETL
jgi:hypothetical protein